MSYTTGIEIYRGRNQKTLEQALNKTYIVKGYGKYPKAVLNLPKCLIGRRVKIVLIKRIKVKEVRPENEDNYY